MSRSRRGRRGLTLIEVLLASVVLMIGTLGVGTLLTNTLDQLSPRGSWGGLRRVAIGVQMLKAQAEGLRVLKDVPAAPDDCVLVTGPAGGGYALAVEKTAAADANAELNTMTLRLTQHGRPLGTLTMSTLRASGALGGLDEKIGL